jgi:hypothetical protein
MGKTSFNPVVVAPTTIRASVFMPIGWQTRRSAKRTLRPHRRMRNQIAWSSLITNPQSLLPSLMPSNVSWAQNSRLYSTLDLAVHVTLPGSVR